MSSPTSSPDPEPAGPPDGADRSTTHRQSPGTDSPAEPAPTAGAAPISAAQLAELVGQLGRAAIGPDARRAWAGVEQAELINVIDQLERLNSARAALQATTTDAFTHAHAHARTGRTPTSTRNQALADQYPQLGNRRTATEAARHAYRLDPEQAVRRHAKAITDRRVTLRPAPDTMTYLTALLPVQHGVAAYAALTTAADTGTATGDPRSRG